MSLADKVTARFLRKAGGANFRVFIRNPDLKRAFRDAVDDARHESGHGGYSGTIAEKHDVVARRREPMSREEAQRFIDEDIDKNDKWGPAFAVPIAETTKGKEKAVRVRVEAMSKMEAYQSALKKLEAENPGAQISVEYNLGGVVELKASTGFTLVPEKVTSTFVEIKTPGIAYSIFKESYGSRAEAVAAIKEVAKTRRDLRVGQTFIIQAVKQTDKITVADPKKMSVWEVSGKAVETKNAGTLIGWILYGVASS